jgi:protein SCO1/2
MSLPGRRAGNASRRHLDGPGLVPAGLALAAIAAALVAACGGAGAGAGGAAGTGAPSGPVFVEAVTQPPLGARDTAYNPPRPAPDLFLTDGDGHPFDLARLRGTPVFVYFGYTHCPDVCPTTLADLREGIKLAAVDAKVVFVTIDPERDDAAAMKQYTDYYQAGYHGLTGTPGQIAEAAAAWGVSYARLPGESAGGYAMAHSTDVYLLDAGGRLRHHIFFGAGSDLIARLLAQVAGP